jgi:hypothetical protein
MKHTITFSTFAFAAMIGVAGLRIIDKGHPQGWVFLGIGIVIAALHAMYLKANSFGR